MRTISIFNSKDLDYVSMTLIGISAPIAIDHYHHLLFGNIHSYSSGILEYITVLSLFILVIMLLSPIYYGLIRLVYFGINQIRLCSLCHKYVPSSIQKGIPLNNEHSIFIQEAVSTSDNENNCSRTLLLSLVEDAIVASEDLKVNEMTTIEPAENENIMVEQSNDSNIAKALHAKKDEFMETYVAALYQNQPIYDLIINTLPRCRHKGKPSPTNSARVFNYLFDLKILCQQMAGLDEATNYFDNELIGESKSAYSDEMKRLASEEETDKKNDKNYSPIMTKVNEEVNKLGIKLIKYDDDQPA